MRHAIAIALAAVMLGAGVAVTRAGDGQTVLGLIADGPFRMGLASRIALAVDHEDGLRILPISGKSPAQNLTDLIQVRGIDLALVPSDALAFVERQELMTGAAQRLDYVVKLANVDVHLVASARIRSIAELQGKTIATGTAMRASNQTALLLFGTLKLDFTALPLNGDDAIAAVKSGKADAALLVGVAPVPEIARLKAADGLHLVAIPPSAGLAGVYAPSLLTADFYPELLYQGATVETVSSALVLAAIHWPKGSPQEQRLTRFSSALFKALLRDGDGAGINLAAKVPGWNRSPAAEAALKQQVGLLQTADPTAQDN